MNIGGIHIVESQFVQPVQKIQIRHDFQWIHDDARNEINTWFLETFGTRHVGYMFDPKAIGWNGAGVMVLNPKMMALIRDFT